MAFAKHPCHRERLSRLHASSYKRLAARPTRSAALGQLLHRPARCRRGRRRRRTCPTGTPAPRRPRRRARASSVRAASASPTTTCRPSIDPGCLACTPLVDRDRARRAGRGQLHEPDLLADREIVVGGEADLLDVERLRPVDVRDGDRTSSSFQSMYCSLFGLVSERDAMAHCGQFRSAISWILGFVLDTSARLLELLSLLQSRPTGPARSWPSASRSVRARFAATSTGCAGSAIRSTRARRRRRLPAGCRHRLPPLLLDAEEAVAIAVGLRTAASAGITGIEETSVRALAKLEQLLRRIASPARSRDRRRDGSYPVSGRGRRRDARDRDRAAATTSGCGSATALTRARSRGSSSRTGSCTPAALVPRRVGLRARGLAHVPRRSDRAHAERRPRFAPREPPPPDLAASSRARLRARDRHQARVVLHASARAGQRARAAPRRHARAARRRSSCLLRPAPTGSRARASTSPTSASTSRCSSRPS